MRRAAPPLVGIATLSATVGPEGFGEITIPAWPGARVSPEQAHFLLDCGPIVDIRTVAVAYPGHRAPYECRWAVAVLSFYEDDGDEAMDAALDQLRKDIQAGRVQPGTHSGRPWPRNVLEPAAEALLREFRDRVLSELGG